MSVSVIHVYLCDSWKLLCVCMNSIYIAHYVRYKTIMEGLVYRTFFLADPYIHVVTAVDYGILKQFP